MSMMIGSSSNTKLMTIKSRDGRKTATVSVSAAKKKKKKRLQYSFKSISNQIMMSKTPNSAKQVATKARGKIAMLQRNLDNDDYDETELRHAIIHAKKMLRIAKKKMKHLEQEEQAKQGSCKVDDTDGGMPDLPDTEEQEQEQKDLELEQMVQEFQDLMNDFMSESMNEMMNEIMEEIDLGDLADEFMSNAKQLDLSPEDLDNLKKKHRSDELREIMEADMKYLKAMINKLEHEQQQASNGFSDIGVTLEISGVQMSAQPVQAPVTPQGEVIDVSL